jgi:hypothetical protein
MEHSKIYSGSIIFLILTIFSSVHKFVCTYLIKNVNITNFTNSLPTDSNLQKTRKNIFSQVRNIAVVSQKKPTASNLKTKTNLIYFELNFEQIFSD